MKLSGLFLIMDEGDETRGEGFASHCNVEFKPGFNIPVIVDADSGKLNNILGQARVLQYGNVLVYEAEITEQSFSKLDPKLAKHFYPCASGKILGREKDGTITGFQITDILISTKNVDKRIPSLKISGTKLSENDSIVHKAAGVNVEGPRGVQNFVSMCGQRNVTSKGVVFKWHEVNCEECLTHGPSAVRGPSGDKLE